MLDVGRHIDTFHPARSDSPWLLKNLLCTSDRLRGGVPREQEMLNGQPTQSRTSPCILAYAQKHVWDTPTNSVQGASLQPKCSVYCCLVRRPAPLSLSIWPTHINDFLGLKTRFWHRPRLFRGRGRQSRRRLFRRTASTRSEQSFQHPQPSTQPSTLHPEP